MNMFDPAGEGSNKMTYFPDAELNAKLEAARELGRQEGWMSAKGFILRGVADIRYDGGGHYSGLKVCDMMRTFITELKSGNFVNLENATLLSNTDAKSEVYLEIAKTLVETAPDLAQQLANSFFAAHQKKYSE